MWTEQAKRYVIDGEKSEIFFIWQDGSVEAGCNAQVDECGFFIYWKSEEKVSWPVSSMKNLLWLTESAYINTVY